MVKAVQPNDVKRCRPYLIAHPIQIHVGAFRIWFGFDHNSSDGENLEGGSLMGTLQRLSLFVLAWCNSRWLQPETGPKFRL
jgi:hypothetical protein